MRSRLIRSVVCLAALHAAAPASANESGGPVSSGAAEDDLRAVSPALAHDGTTDLWKRAGLSPPDRSLVTVAALITQGQTIDLGNQVRMALDNGVEPAEISEVITHLAFHAGRSNALSAAGS